MVKDHLDGERGNPLPPHGLLFPISSKGYFIAVDEIHQQKNPKSTNMFSPLSSNTRKNLTEALSLTSTKLERDVAPW